MRTKKRLFSILLSFTIALGSITSTIIPAFAAEAAQTGENDYMKFFVGTRAAAYQGFSVQGKNGDSWLSTTYRDEGFESAIRVDGSTKKFDSFAYGKEYTTGNVTAYVTARLQDQKAFIDYTIINNNSTEKTVNIGSYGDVQIGANDSAPVSAIDAGSVLMTDGTNEFRLIPGSGDPFTTTWYGRYSDAGSKVFEDLDPKNPITNLDSGIAWSWTIIVPANGTVTKTAILSAGAATTFTIRYNANGGSGTMTPTGAEYNTTVKLKKNEFMKEGCLFAGWDTNSAGTTVVYEDEAEITMPNTDTTLYAVWKNNPDITATATGFEGTYDGESHGITVNVTDPASGAVIKYGKTEGTYDLDSSPAITNVADSPLTVYFKVTADGYKDYNGSATVTINKADAVAATVTANNRTYDGTEHPLVTVTGEPTGGTMQYALGTDETTAPTEGWKDTIPAATEAGTYYVWYYVKGDSNHTDSEPVCIMMKIAGAAYTVTDGEHTINDGKDTSVTVKREPDDSKTYDLYTGAQVDGKALPEGSHTTAKGSLVMTLKAAYLDTLSVGDHKLTIAFEDGSATATIRIKDAEPTPPPAPTAAPTATPKPVPKTGDGSNPALWLSLAVAGLILIAGTVILWNRKKRCGK